MRFCLYVALICALAAPVAAQDPAREVYECEMHNQGRGGWISEVMYLSLERESERGVVMDGVIYLVHEVPIEVDTRMRNKDLWVFRWTVEDVPSDSGGSSTVRYKAALNIKDGTVRVTGILLGYDNNINGSGRCREIG